MVAFIFHSIEPGIVPVRAPVIRSPSGSDFCDRSRRIGGQGGESDGHGQDGQKSGERATHRGIPLIGVSVGRGLDSRITLL
jgi:hypothetical protein